MNRCSIVCLFFTSIYCHEALEFEILRKQTNPFNISNQFACTNGQNIEATSKCNGTAECDDKSDETRELCLNLKCPVSTVKCEYGACINESKWCDKVDDCVDLSDEELCNKHNTTQLESNADSGKNCLAPQQPINGNWTYFPPKNIQSKSNEVVSPYIQIRFTCDDTFKLSTTYRDEELIYCKEDGQWSIQEFPYCEKICPNLSNHSHTIPTCQFDGFKVPCEKATNMTELTYTCDPYYEPETRGTNICHNGEWTDAPSKCKESCGQKHVSAETLIVNGADVKRGDYPWAIALYHRKSTNKNYINICGGSLLSTSIVLTAAHCVSTTIIAHAVPKEHFLVAAGKYYNKYMDERDLKTAQYSQLKDIIRHEEYRGEIQNFRYDFALLVLEKPFVMSPYVQTVCLGNLPKLYNYMNLSITGWGFTTTGKPSDALQVAELQYVDNNICRNELDKEFADRYLIDDKICAGNLNQSVSVCNGDSGGALVVKDEHNRYFVKGITSLNPHIITRKGPRHCNIKTRSLFTHLNEEYLNWIEMRMKLLNHYIN